MQDEIKNPHRPPAFESHFRKKCGMPDYAQFQWNTPYIVAALDGWNAHALQSQVREHSIAKILIAIVFLGVGGYFAMKAAYSPESMRKVEAHNLPIIQEAIHRFQDDKKQGPYSLEELVGKGYLDKLPLGYDPSGRSDTWVLKRDATGHITDIAPRSQH